MFESILSDATTMTAAQIFICTGASLVLGLIIAFVTAYRSKYSRNLFITIALLPALVQSVIMIVNGNLGAGVAVMGAFGLVRFRSMPGSAREIACIFFSMAVGLAIGMGYIAYAGLFTLIISMVLLIYEKTGIGGAHKEDKELRIVIPEDVDYMTAFDDLFDEYTTRTSLDKVRTANLGGLYELRYTIVLRDERRQKEFIDKIRCRNGNLKIVLSGAEMKEGL